MVPKEDVGFDSRHPLHSNPLELLEFQGIFMSLIDFGGHTATAIVLCNRRLRRENRLRIAMQPQDGGVERDFREKLLFGNRRRSQYAR